MRFFYATGSGGSGGSGGNIPGDTEHASEDYYYDNGDNGEGEDKRGFFSKYKWILAFVGVMALVNICSDDDAPVGPPCSPTAAYRYANDVIKNRLKSPHSAVFPEVGVADMTNIGNIRKGTVRVVRIGNQQEECKWGIYGYVDAQNSLGAMMRNTYSMDVEYRDETFFASNIVIY